MSPSRGDSAEQLSAGWRTWIGLALLFLSLGWPVLLPVLHLCGAPGTAIAAFSGLMIIVAELMLLAGAAIAGKEGFEFIKANTMGRLRDFGPLRDVGPLRYKLGLIMFVIPLVLGWAVPYYGQHIPGYESHPLAFAIVFDAMLLTSLFVLGAGFWDKLGALFSHKAGEDADSPSGES